MSAVAPLPRRLAAVPRRLLRLRSDAALGERFASGDDLAFAVLYERHAPSVLAVCIGVVGCRHDAEDVAQETFAALAVALRDRPPRELRPWLVRVARNAAIDLLRRRRGKPMISDAAGSLASGMVDRAVDGVAGGAGRGRSGSGIDLGGEGRIGLMPDVRIRTELEAVLAGIRELPASQRTALLLRELAGHSYAEIATLLEIDEQAVRGLIARARAGLRNYREATELPCAVARAEIAAEPDGRRYDATVRRHLRRCEGCRAYRDALRSDARALRGLTPMPAGGLAGGGAVVGLFAKGAMTGGVLAQAGAVCAVSVCSVGGAVLLYPHALAMLGHHATVLGYGSAPRSDSHARARVDGHRGARGVGWGTGLSGGSGAGDGGGLTVPESARAAWSTASIGRASGAVVLEARRVDGTLRVSGRHSVAGAGPVREGASGAGGRRSGSDGSRWGEGTRPRPAGAAGSADGGGAVRSGGDGRPDAGGGTASAGAGSGGSTGGSGGGSSATSSGSGGSAATTSGGGSDVPAAGDARSGSWPGSGSTAAGTGSDGSYVPGSSGGSDGATTGGTSSPSTPGSGGSTAAASTGIGGTSD